MNRIRVFVYNPFCWEVLVWEVLFTSLLAGKYLSGKSCLHHFLLGSICFRSLAYIPSSWEVFLSLINCTLKTRKLLPKSLFKQKSGFLGLVGKISIYNYLDDMEIVTIDSVALYFQPLFDKRPPNHNMRGPRTKLSKFFPVDYFPIMFSGVCLSFNSRKD